MSHSNVLLNAILNLKDAKSAEAVFKTLKKTLKTFGSTHLLVTGIPMPQKKLGPSILCCDWLHKIHGADFRPETSDLIIQKSIDWPRPFILKKQFYHSSGLAIAAGLPDEELDILIIPHISNRFFQGVVVTTIGAYQGLTENAHSVGKCRFDQSLLSCLIECLFAKLEEFGALDNSREGELTAREREVLSLSALGKTSEEIGKVLKISERTVIAHIQNASAKLNAANRTECVLQAIRYNQIGPGAGLGFYQIETEVYKI